jgi:hypothetical protein
MTTAVSGGVKTPKKENQNTHYRNKLMVQSLPTVGTERAVKVVT